MIEECFIDFYDYKEYEFDISYFDGEFTISVLNDLRERYENFDDCLTYLDELKELYLKLDNCSKKLEQNCDYTIDDISSYSSDECIRITFKKN